MTELSADNFAAYFSNLSDTVRTGNVFSENEIGSHCIDELDRHITVYEIEKLISSMNRNKSCDLEHNVADFFIECKSFISPYLCTIFNHIFGTCSYPDAWTKGIIVPLYKKGDPQQLENYRGITLMNINAKFFL